MPIQASQLPHLKSLIGPLARKFQFNTRQKAYNGAELNIKHPALCYAKPGEYCMRDDETESLPTEGFVRIKQILRVLPIGKSTWWLGVKEGKYPQPVKHGRCTFWRVEDIRKLIAQIEGE